MNIENVHPFPLFNGRYQLMQNGSAKEMHGWGVMNFIESDEERPDTYYLARFLEERDADDFNKMLVVFSELEKKKISLGVVIVYDMLTDTFFCISDGARSLYVDLDLENQRIEYFSSIDDDGDDGYSFFGWFVSDMEGNVSSSEFKYFNKYVEKKKTYQASSHYGPSSGGKVYDSTTQTWIYPPVTHRYEDDNDYYTNAYANQAAARAAVASRTKLPPSGGDVKAPKSDSSQDKGTTTGTQTALIVQETKKGNNISNTEITERIEKARKITKDYEGLNEYSDNVVLDVTALLETNVYLELEEYFYDRYRDATIRNKHFPNSNKIVYDKILTNLENCLKFIEEELDLRRDLWIDNFYEVESNKEKLDTLQIDKWIEDKMDTLRFHLMDLYN